MTTAAQRMPPFVYFFAGVVGERPQEIPEAWRRRFRLDGLEPFPGYPRAAEWPGGCVTRHCDAGPGGGPGLLACPYEVTIDRLATALTWPPPEGSPEPIEVEPGVWLAVSAAFNPFDVARRPLLAPLDINQVRCITTRHAEPAHRWVIPCCLVGHPDCVLPMIDHYERGAWKAVPKHQYAHISEVAATIYRSQTGQGDKPDRDWFREAVCDAVAVNYDISDVELAALGILDDDFYYAVAMLLTGGAAMRGSADG